MTKRVWPDIAIPPGDHLAEELAARGMSQSELARKMERPVQVINEIVRGKKSITGETALQLEAVLGIGAETWMNLEGNYQITKALVARRARAPKRSARAQAPANR
jgi:HTH-type transcriptional regulator/antitoxin HigA